MRGGGSLHLHAEAMMKTQLAAKGQRAACKGTRSPEVALPGTRRVQARARERGNYWGGFVSKRGVGSALKEPRHWEFDKSRH